MQTYPNRDDAVSRAIPLAQSEGAAYYIGRIERRYCLWPETATYNEVRDAFEGIPSVLCVATPDGGFRR